MAWWSLVASRWRNLVRRTRVERDLDDELRGYVQMLADEKVRDGLSPADARRAALLDVGGVEQVKEQVRDVKVGVLLQQFLPTLCQDLRYAARMLARQPGFSAAAVLALALGIGATTAIFSVVDGVLLRPLPFPQADRLASVFMRFTPQNMERGPLSMADYLDLRAAGTRAFEDLALYQSGRLDLTGTDAPEPVIGSFVTPGFFTTLGVRPLHGRTFLPGEEAPNGSRLLIISERLWKRRYHGDPAVVGRVIIGNGLPYTIVGVMPASLAFPGPDIDFWGNLWMTPPTRRGPFMFYTVGRLKPGATLLQAQADADLVAPRIERADSKTYLRLSMPVVPLRDVLVRDAKPALLVMLAAVGVVLLIATVNVANLLLARAAARGREIAVRLSLGASRARLIRQLLTESVLLALIGGALGVGLAYAGLEVLRATNAGNIPRIEAVQIDLRVLLVTGVIAIATGLLFGLAPALQTVRPGLTRTLKDGGDRSATASRARRRLHAALVIAEIALSLMLLIGAGLLLRSFFRLQQVDVGLQAPASEIVSLWLSPSRARFLVPANNTVPPGRTAPAGNTIDDRAVDLYYEQVLARVRQVPGVASVALAAALPPNRMIWSDSFVIEGQSPAEAQHNPSVVIPSVSPDYFRAMGIPLLRGRTFDARDTATSTPVTVISDDMARHYFVGRDPIGARVKLSGAGLPDNPRLEVIGVVGNVKYKGLGQDDEPVYYRAYAQASELRRHLVVRAAGNASSRPSWLRTLSVGVGLAADAGVAASLAPTVRREIQAFDRDVVITQVSTMETALAESVAGPRFRMLLLGVFAGVALLLAATGIYAVMAYSVVQRTHELGLRLALGAARGDLLRLVLGQAAWLALVGVGLGLAGALVVTRWMRTLLFGVEATDPLTFAGVAAGLVGVALLATLVPARRAMGVDPMVALRQD